MSHNNHHILKCDECEKIIAQCRCPAKDKVTSYETCNECKAKKVPVNKMIGGVDDKT